MLDSQASFHYYNVLSQQILDADEPAADRQPGQDDHCRTECSVPWTYTAAICIALFFALVDMTIVIVFCAHIDAKSYLLAQERTSELEFASPYINLEELYANKSFATSRHGPITNHARHFMQVSSTQPTRVLPTFEFFGIDPAGTVPIYNRYLSINGTISTIVQFRVMDFGMEMCTLTLSVPPKNATNNIIEGFGQETATISVWSFPKATSLVPSELSWATKPKERVHFGSLHVAYNASFETFKFRCPSLSLQTFELSCASPDCNVQIIGIGTQDNGLFLRQYQSI